jgi:phosphatidylethanolamine/phosphatidyl-N-methylethanolamine N-methyltransferase
MALSSKFMMNTYDNSNSIGLDKVLMVERVQVETIYRRWAPIYDFVFDKLFEYPRREAVIAAEQVGGRILEVGVGTGLSLDSYSDTVKIVGIDISPDMLDQARRRVERQKLVHVERLDVMDAQELQFSDAEFDVVMAQYVVNTVPDPDAALAEFVRVLRPGGELIIVNRVGASGGIRRAAERIMQPIVERFGWSSEFPWVRFEAFLRAHSNMRLVERRAMPPFGNFALIRFAKVTH